MAITSTPGDFVALISYLGLLTWPMMAMGWVTNLLQRGSASMRRINRVLDELPEIEEPAAPAAVKALRGEVRMENLTFTYPSQNRPALREIRLRIEPGETVALVGRVGSGKSTLLQIIPRLMPPPPGTVFLDGYAVEALPIATLRRQIAFVTQEPFVFSDTIRNNVLFGRRGLTEEQVRDTLDAAGILDEVDQFDRGLDTILGERGITLSGGQRQRLTIARALVLDAPILILDDALAMVDTRTEEAILNSLFSMRRGRTNLIVSHRVSTIRRADRILVLDEGRLVEEGDHTSLLRRRGLYAALYEKELLSRSLETEADA
ncbi:fused lipid transporter subunits of ABC superfamily: membrane component; ATP-binding component (fragment) [uncultured Desulfatiglans sp.]|uniref:Fused lipid transporter subunits of ABC superfamily: membrane component ATP-binding component n=1 Tax=Uncultured Desulfatiglans sp. TaxID=1748965 RepID=A0A653AIK7_UNCDX